MSSEKEINQLTEKLKNRIDRAGIDNILHNLASNGDNTLEQNESGITLNGLDNTILKLMMTDYVKN